AGRADDASVTVPAGATTTLDQRPAVEQAFENYMTMVKRLYGAPEPTDPEIGQRTAGAERQAFEATLAKYRARRLVVRTGPQARQTILSSKINGSTAMLKVCFVGQSGIYDATTGVAKQPMAIVTEPAVVTLTFEEGTWKVSHVRSGGHPVKGVSTCAS